MHQKIRVIGLIIVVGGGHVDSRETEAAVTSNGSSRRCSCDNAMPLVWDYQMFGMMTRLFLENHIRFWF